MPRILVVDDEKNYLMVLAQLLEEEGYSVETADNPFAALDILSHSHVSLILSDLKMPRMNGLEFMRRAQEESPDIPFVIMTAYATVQTAIGALKAGAFDYLLKPFKNEEFLLTVNKALEFARLKSENRILREQLERSQNREFIGESPVVRTLLDDIAQVAPTRTSVLVLGESGTGKELVARSLHQQSPRASGPLVTLNCAAFAEPLLESELFGHERGAFTGAVERKRGLMEVANGGTLFLDEIGELPLRLQPKLLRVLQDRCFRRVGGTAEIETDARIIAATHRDLPQMIGERTFREDLYYRLNVVSLQVPPLRERPEDIPLLAQHFLGKFSKELGRNIASIDTEAMEQLCRHRWPGNIRELRNAIERAAIFCQDSTLHSKNLPPALRESSVDEPSCAGRALPADRPLPEVLDELEKKLIGRALVKARGIQAQAAEILGISRSNLQYKLKKYDLL